MNTTPVQPTVPAETAEPQVLTAPQLRDAAVESISRLAPLGDVVERTMEFYVAYPPDDKLIAEEVAKELPSTIGCTGADLTKAASDVQAALDEERDEVAQVFSQMTGKTFVAADVKAFQIEFERELREEAQKRESNNAIIGDVANLCGKFAIPNPDPALKPLKALSVLDTARAALSLRVERGLAKLTTDLPVKKNADKPICSWLSDVTLTADHPAVVRLNILKKNIDGVADLAKIEPKLAAKHLGAAERPVLFAELMKAAREDQQIIDQSEANVKREYQMVVEAINAVSRVENYTKYVLGFFPSEKSRVTKR